MHRWSVEILTVAVLLVALVLILDLVPFDPSARSGVGAPPHRRALSRVGLALHYYHAHLWIVSARVRRR